VYEYVNNGNLGQWLHGDVGPVSPLTWQIRMKIILGIAKGEACLSSIQHYGEHELLFVSLFIFYLQEEVLQIVKPQHSLPSWRAPISQRT
jgi:hypothetical protein